MPEKSPLWQRVEDSVRTAYKDYAAKEAPQVYAYLLGMGLKEKQVGPTLFFSQVYKNTLVAELVFFCPQPRTHPPVWQGKAYLFYFIFDDHGNLKGVIQSYKYYN